jgi:hypothetical protein
MCFAVERMIKRTEAQANDYSRYSSALRWVELWRGGLARAGQARVVCVYVCMCMCMCL